MINVDKTVYDKPSSSDGERILVMRFWPRGVRKQTVDTWLKDLGTERDLITRWKSGKVAWAEFVKQYRKSLRGKEDLLKDLAEKSRKGNITLLCTDKDASHCHRTILAQEIQKLL